ncbi:MAG TPA: biopolymer transporter ExbD [Bryobacteraceae bacterium]|jgi:biopolymer transport protein ExbD/biopolymer transport protein TolR
MKLQAAPPPVADINVTPMVDVMLVVLIIFMVITPMLNKGANIDLPKARNTVAFPDADKEDAVKVSITRDSQVYLSPGLERVNPDDLAPKVRDLLQNRTSRVVFLRADARAKYGKVEDVVDNLRSGGVDQLGLLTEQDMTPLDSGKK